MFDAAIRPLIDRPLAIIARRLVALKISANQVTAAGFLLGIAAAALVASHQMWAALAVFLLSRVLDGLDGAVARQTKLTDLGGYLDITLDFVTYTSMVLGFAIADPAHNALAAAFLAASFMAPASTFLAYAVFAAKRGITTEIRGRKSLFYLGGLTEGFETILALSLMCVFPDWFPVMAVIYGMMCWVTGGTRIAAAIEAFGEEEAAS